MWLIVHVQSMPKMKLDYCNRLGKVRSMMKARQDNDLMDRIGMVHIKNETKILWLIK